MTAQTQDTIHYRENTYALVGVKGSPLFEPVVYGLLPRVCTTALWRGFHCLYEILDSQLYLKQLSICLDTEPSILLGNAPVKSNDPQGFDAIYKELGLKISFSGGLLLAKDFIQELYVHMGFHPAWKYREVHELIFDRGDLTAEHDRTKAIADMRNRIDPKPYKRPRFEDHESIMKWITDTFKLDYDYWDN
jgi:hypothetical protein